jgi:UV DNA damage repair endonuclease
MHARVLDGIRTDAVVLMHDGLGPGARRSGCEQTVQLIPRLTETMRARRLLPLPLSELSR